MYVIIRNKDGKYVARPGSEKSYTDKLEKAAVYGTRNEAEKNRCVESETVRDLITLLEGAFTS